MKCKLLPSAVGTFLLTVVCLSSSVAGQEVSSPTENPPALEATIPIEHLKIQLRPLTLEELEEESAAWLTLLKDKIRALGEVELAILQQPEGENSEQLKSQLAQLRTEEVELVQRVNATLEAIKSKGGDVEQEELFVKAVSDVNETVDSTAYWVAIMAEFKNWYSREDGGVYWRNRILLALGIVFIFWLVSKVAGRASSRVIHRHPKASLLLENFVRKTAGGLVFIVGVLMALAALGVEIGPMMAALGAGGFIVGFALQETLGSFASGLMIMVNRPFDVNDYVSVSGVEGTVQEMSLVSTTLLTIDNKVVVIPNKKAWADTITNYTGKDIRRVDLIFGIAYDDDIEHAMSVLQEITRQHPLVLDEPAPMVQVDELADSAVNLFCRPWVKTSDYWTVHWDLTREVKLRFDDEGLSFPFPQRDIHVFTESSDSVDPAKGGFKLAGPKGRTGGLSSTPSAPKMES